ncbi:10892_t:CDS:2, partial [Gigaspora rosea]
MRNSLSVQHFNYLWDKLLLKFPDAAPYLNHALSNDKEKWALCYTSKIFTAGMQSTQRVKSQNSIIKNSVNSNTSLINLVKYIDEQINRASSFIQYKNWIHSITGSTLNHASSEFLPDIDEWITTHLTPLQFDSIEQLNLSEKSNVTGQYDLTETNTDNLFAEDAVDVP